MIFNYIFFTGSFHNSNRHIEPELLKIIQNHSCLDELSLFVNENQHLLECLPYITLKETVGSLTANEDFDLMKYSEFLTMSKNVKEKAGTGSEPFLDALLKPMKSVKLSSEILALLVEYYNNAYSNSFVSLSDIHNSLPGTIAVFPQINRFDRLRLGAEVYGSTYAKRYIRSVNVLSKFVLDDNTTDTYLGQIHFFFEHTIHLLEGSITHSLAFVRWYSHADHSRTRFHCSINDDNKSSNIELWKSEFYEIGRDCIIPIHNILSRFVAETVMIGKKNPKKYLSVISINRKIHI